MRITGSGIWGLPADRTDAISTVRRCLDLRVTLIDTAEAYGPYVSEELIAEALYPYPAELVIATKVGLDRPGPHQWRNSGHPDRLRKGLDGSLRRLRLERIDLYQLHRIDPDVPEDDQFGFLQEAQRAGKVRFVGLSEVGVAQIQRAQRFFPVVSVQNRYNLIDRQWEEVLEFCEREQIAFLPWYPLQAGAFGQSVAGVRGRSFTPPAVEINDAVTRIAKKHDATPAQIALAWLLRRSPVVLPIPGTSRRDHLEENVAAAAIQLSRDEFASLA